MLPLILLIRAENFSLSNLSLSMELLTSFPSFYISFTLDSSNTTYQWASKPTHSFKRYFPWFIFAHANFRWCSVRRIGTEDLTFSDLVGHSETSPTSPWSCWDLKKTSGELGLKNTRTPGAFVPLHKGMSWWSLLMCFLHCKSKVLLYYNYIGNNLLLFFLVVNNNKIILPDISYSPFQFKLRWDVRMYLVSRMRQEGKWPIIRASFPWESSLSSYVAPQKGAVSSLRKSLWFQMVTVIQKKSS